jgi:hypothetical protein
MSMSGEEICALAEQHTEDLRVDRTIGLALINECMILDLGKDAGVISSQTVDLQADKWNYLDNEFLNVFEIEKEGQTYPYYGSKYGKSYSGVFDIKDNMIRLPEDGIFTIWGYVSPRPLRAIEAKPAVHPIFHYAISLYVAARITFQDDEENPSANMLLQEYHYYREKALEHIKEMRPKTKPTRLVKKQPWI